MKREISELLKISDYYGSNKDFVIAGGGNTSFKDDLTIWIKASGIPLAGLTEEGLVALSREKLSLISVKQYPDDPIVREKEVKEDMFRNIPDLAGSRGPSMESSFHDLIKYKFVVHLHPTIVNGVLCSHNARNLTHQLFGDKVLFVQYTDPGFSLFKKLGGAISSYREKFEKDPQIIFIENLGSIVSADSPEEIKEIYNEILMKIGKVITPFQEFKDLPYNPLLNKVLPAMRILLSGDQPKVLRYRHNTLIAKYYKSQQEFQKISHPLTPDNIVYCKHRYLYIEQASTPDRILESFKGQLERFVNEFKFLPKIIVIKDMGVFAVEDNYNSAESVLDVYEDLIRISHLSSQCGGTRLLTPDQVTFIDQRDVGNFRRKVSQDNENRNNLINKVAIITGGVHGFGAGIAEALYSMTVNVVVADINEETGCTFVTKINNPESTNRAFFVRTDVSDPESVKELINSTVKQFGGLDIMISNAGVLQAEGLAEIEPDTFSITTDINYKGYFHCAKYASEVLKIQNRENPEYFSDIIQINSISDLQGGSRNFAYSGSKYGGIGLTQSFAMELAPHRIKVNSICPGNFYEDPLWSDPHTGLFVHYLKTGKVPGAKSIDDVRKFYEEQIPMKRGSRVEDVLKAIFYVIDQQYETGQSIPVTGGQVMLG